MTDLIGVKTADLVSEALGWAVGKAEGLNLELVPPQYGNPWRVFARYQGCLLYTSPSPRDLSTSRMPSSA